MKSDKETEMYFCLQKIQHTRCVASAEMHQDKRNTGGMTRKQRWCMMQDYCSGPSRKTEKKTITKKKQGTEMCCKAEKACKKINDVVKSVKSQKLAGIIH